jgi:hypothetical protein
MKHHHIDHCYCYHFDHLHRMYQLIHFRHLHQEDLLMVDELMMQMMFLYLRLHASLEVMIQL